MVIPLKIWLLSIKQRQELLNLSSNNGSSYNEADVQTLVHFFSTQAGQVSLISFHPTRTMNIYSRIKHPMTSKVLAILRLYDSKIPPGELPKMRLLPC